MQLCSGGSHTGMYSFCSVLWLALCSASALEPMEVTLELERLPPAGPPKIVLLLDVSGSMRQQNRNYKLFHAVHRWIEHQVPDNLMLGMVKFSSHAEVLSKLQLVGVSRAELLENIPRAVSGNTCLGCGLKKALALFAGDTMNSVIILVTDGNNSEPGQGIGDILTLVQQSGARIVTVVYGNSVSDNIEQLAKVSQGLTYYVIDAEGVTALSGALQGALTLLEPPPPESITLFESEQSSSSLRLSGEFEIDAAVADNVQLCVYYGPGEVVDSILLVMPDGQIYATTEAERNKNLKTVTFNLHHVMVGSWQLAIESKSFNKLISVIVSSPPMESRDLVPLTLNCWVKAEGGPISIHASVQRGKDAVVNAQVSAELVFPDGSIKSIPLWDNGVGSDTVRYDGQYTRFAPPVLSVGRYSVRCSAVGLANTTIIHTIGANTIHKLPSGNFSRMKRTTSFKVLTTERPGHYPPFTITDLQLAKTQDSSFILNFTAPGSELDWGEASSYRLMLASSKSAASNSSAWDTAITISQPPAPSGNTDIIVVPKQPSQTYVSLCAVGTTGLLGKPSNVIELPTIISKEETTTKTETTWYKEKEHTSTPHEDKSDKGNVGNFNRANGTSHEPDNSIEGISSTMLIIIITSVTVFLLLIIFVSMKLIYPRFRVSYRLVRSK